MKTFKTFCEEYVIKTDPHKKVYTVHDHDGKVVHTEPHGSGAYDRAADHVRKLKTADAMKRRAEQEKQHEEDDHKKPPSEVEQRYIDHMHSYDKYSDRMKKLRHLGAVGPDDEDIHHTHLNKILIKMKHLQPAVRRSIQTGKHPSTHHLERHWFR